MTEVGRVSFFSAPCSIESDDIQILREIWSEEHFPFFSDKQLTCLKSLQNTKKNFIKGSNYARCC